MGNPKKKSSDSSSGGASSSAAASSSATEGTPRNVQTQEEEGEIIFFNARAVGKLLTVMLNAKKTVS